MGRSGFCVWFTGLPASGKTTAAVALKRSMDGDGHPVEILDGETLRERLSPELGFTPSDRETHLRRVASLAARMVKEGKIVLCATISPYRKIRLECRERIGSERFVEVFVDAPLSVCQRRDPKGLYARARKGEISDVTGIQDPYEPPLKPKIRIDTVRFSAEENARRILGFLHQRELLPWR